VCRALPRRAARDRGPLTAVARASVVRPQAPRASKRRIRLSAMLSAAEAFPAAVGAVARLPDETACAATSGAVHDRGPLGQKLDESELAGPGLGVVSEARGSAGLAPDAWWGDSDDEACTSDSDCGYSGSRSEESTSSAQADGRVVQASVGDDALQDRDCRLGESWGRVIV